MGLVTDWKTVAEDFCTILLLQVFGLFQNKFVYDSLMLQVLSNANMKYDSLMLQVLTSANMKYDSLLRSVV